MADDGGFEALLDAWLPLTYALNAINRSMSAADVYPFVLTAEVQRKRESSSRCDGAPTPGAEHPVCLG